MKIFRAIVTTTFLLGAPAIAQQPDATRTVVLAYDRCVKGSIAAQIDQLPPQAIASPDISMMTEIAFQACATEEKALYRMFLAAGPEQAQTLLLTVKIKIKTALQNRASH